MSWNWRPCAGVGLFCALASRAWAGGSGLNVVVIVNQNSTNSVQLGNYYCEQRGVPPQNLLRTSWAGGNVQWTTTELTNAILNPFVAMLSARQLTNQIEHIVLSMDFPYRVTEAGDANGTTAALFYGFKTNISNNPCSLPGGS